jgi:hypothetical protein
VEGIGRLLFFDPTDNDTPLGHLPRTEQGSYALISAGAAGKLVRMPVIPSEANALMREIALRLAPDGSMQGSLRETSSGFIGSRDRSVFSGGSSQDYTRLMERRVSNGAPSAAVSALTPTGSDASGNFSVSLDFAVPRYAKLMASNMMLLTPAIATRHLGPDVSEQKRELPLVLDAQRMIERVTVELPAGWSVDEAPPRLEMNTRFGKFSGYHAMEGGKLVMERRLELPHAEFNAQDYAELRKFFANSRGYALSPVVLVRK